MLTIILSDSAVEPHPPPLDRVISHDQARGTAQQKDVAEV